MQTAIQRFRSISAILRELNQTGLKMQTVERPAYHVCRSSQPTRTTYNFRAVRGSCQLRQRDCGLLGLSLQAEMSLPHYSTSHYVWADSGWARRYIDTLRRHGRPGIPSSPPSWRPLNPRTLTPSSPPHPSKRGQLHQLQVTLSQQNGHTPHFSLNHWERPSVHTGPKKRWSTRYNKRHINSFFLAFQQTPSREQSLSPKQPKTQEQTYNNPTAKLTRRTIGCFRVSSCQTTHATPPSR